MWKHIVGGLAIVAVLGCLVFIGAKGGDDGNHPLTARERTIVACEQATVKEMIPLERDIYGDEAWDHAHRYCERITP